MLEPRFNVVNYSRRKAGSAMSHNNAKLSAPLREREREREREFPERVLLTR